MRPDSLGYWSKAYLKTGQSSRFMPLSRFQLNTQPLTEVRGDVDQRIERKSRNATPQQLIDARLRLAAMLCRFKLHPSFLLNQRLV